MVRSPGNLLESVAVNNWQMAAEEHIERYSSQLRACGYRSVNLEDFQVKIGETIELRSADRSHGYVISYPAECGGTSAEEELVKSEESL